MANVKDKAECQAISDVFDELGDYLRQIAAFQGNWENQKFCKRHLKFMKTLKRFLEDRVEEDGNRCLPRYKVQLEAVNKAYWILFKRAYGREPKSERVSK